MAGGFGGRNAILGKQEVDDCLGRFRAEFGRDGDQGARAAAEIGGEVESGGGGECDRARGGVCQAGSPGLGRRAVPGRRRAGSRILTAISGTGRGQRSRRAMTMSNSQSAKVSEGALGRPGGRRNARAAAFAAAETGSPSPAQAFRLAARPFESTTRSSRAAASRIRPGSRLGGRPAPSRHSDRRFAAGPPGSPTAKRRSRSAASSALRRRILAEAARSAAPAVSATPRRRAAQRADRRREAQAQRRRQIGDRPPLPSAGPRPSRDRGRRQGLPFQGFRHGSLGSRALGERRGKALRTVRSAVVEQVEIGANHWGMVNRLRRFVTLCRAETAGLVLLCGCPIRLQYQAIMRA